ncbi:hypothetical protein GT360_16140 [Vibrio astriarenae]|uniref:Uncharacterized protein n=1 Tax=Vibrio astriarenae TaxID=1481923 RepID=A0A7Z2T697_9VIBR|nr:hypothetical protein [Vibrio astriarenae]QIA65091.1 hypothetical protein GT360_16140 [Vibrio astriarenae]
MILKRIEQVLDLNSLSYEAGINVIYIKLGGGANNVKIQYQHSDNTFRTSHGFWNQVMVSLFTISAFMIISHAIPGWNYSWLILILAVNFLSAMVIQIITEIRLLDLRAQLREVGIYLTPASQFEFRKSKVGQ